MEFLLQRMNELLKEAESEKSKVITQMAIVEDGFHQEFVIIDNDESKLYDSIADAKRVIRGEQPYYEIN